MGSAASPGFASHPHAGPATTLRDELDAAFLKGSRQQKTKSHSS
jgi:hypothetical protein